MRLFFWLAPLLAVNNNGLPAVSTEFILMKITPAIAVPHVPAFD